MKKWQKVSLVASGIVCSIVVITCVYLWATPYKLIDENSLKSDENVMVKDSNNWITFFPSENNDEAGVIFYPGGRVEANAYAPIARRVAEQGVPFIIAKMPLHLAVLSSNKADTILEKFDEREWVLAGHSLGGAMAARYVKHNPDRVSGLILLAAYPAEGDDLTDFAGEVLTIKGQLDGVINEERLTESDHLLPSQTSTIIIQGGNHSQFGDYGLQNGDNEAKITKEEQWNRIVEAIVRSF
ncbi:alpha/beta fold hydrolase [Sutcliffiella rhizosphaerae]|uniref:Alpha/beta hydrolase fold-5 domain-containing protein n=1 Tax=Sutcliffiella rhizosphaerae TaxID=2880967 RepID=A0ABM8YL88_9BACI|nr:alpha/beta fold hydrolase [Sutcliffiella rhizosphaerae]CAG9620517.1 hypothetical protein BACCIP111883_01286 [Sutcliffiella rhizosphaerae]